LKKRASGRNPKAAGRNPKASGRNPKVAGRNPKPLGRNPNLFLCIPKIGGHHWPILGAIQKTTQLILNNL